MHQTTHIFQPHQFDCEVRDQHNDAGPRPQLSKYRIPLKPTQQFPSAAHFFAGASAFFFGPSIGSPILLPVSRTFAAFCNLTTTSMAGNSAPVRSRSATYLTS